MKTVLIVGHPDLRSSRINAALLEESKSIQDVHIRVLSELYGTGSIDIQAEQDAVAGLPTSCCSTPPIGTPCRRFSNAGWTRS